MVEPREDAAEGAGRLQALIALYNEQCVHGRHTETQRHAVAAMFLAGAGVFISVIGTMKFALSAAPLAICVVALGVYARRFVAEFERKWDEAGVRRQHYRKQIEKLTGVIPVPDKAYAVAADEQKAKEEKERAAAQARFRARFPWAAKLRGDARTTVRKAAASGLPRRTKTLRLYWRNTFAAVSAAGALCLLVIVAKRAEPLLARLFGLD